MSKGDNWYISSFGKKKSNNNNNKTLSIFQTLLKRDLSLHDYNLARDLHFRRWFDGLDFVSRSQVCQKNKLQTVLFRFLFRFPSTVVEMLSGCYIHSEDHARYELCDPGVCSKGMISMFLVGQVSGFVQNFSTGIFSNIINVINVKICTMVLHTEIYLFVKLSVTLFLFQGHSSVNQL